MIEKIKSFYHEVKSSPLAHGKVFKHTQIKVDEARCVHNIPSKTQWSRGKRKRAAVFFVSAGQWIDRSSAAEGHDWRDLDVSQDLADEDVRFASRPLLFFFSQG